jgi:hypothetical protein
MYNNEETERKNIVVVDSHFLCKKANNISKKIKVNQKVEMGR